MTERREIQRERERDSSPAQEDEREMKIGEGEGVDRRNVSQSCILKGRKPLSPCSSSCSLSLLLAQGMHGTRKGKRSERMRKERRERAKPSVSYLLRSSHLFLSPS